MLWLHMGTQKKEEGVKVIVVGMSSIFDLVTSNAPEFFI
jgi:hypothetical protein